MRRRFMGNDAFTGVGVYIQDVLGRYFAIEEWSNLNIPNGIAVLTGKCRFVIALKDVKSIYKFWSQVNDKLPDVTLAVDTTTAVQDFAGKDNTDAIVAAYPSSHHTAAKDCADFIFPNGNKGYLGAAGEWDVVLKYKTEIIAAISACNGQSFSDSYWTSTQLSGFNAWAINWRTLNLKYEGKTNYQNYIRAFTSVNSEYNEKGGILYFYISQSPIGQSSYNRYEARRGMTWREWSESVYNNQGFKLGGDRGQLVLTEDDFGVAYGGVSICSDEIIIEERYYDLM